MKRYITILTVVLTLALVTAGVAAAEPPEGAQPNFCAGVYADGEAWGTKGTTDLPAPTDHNLQSYDLIFAFTNGAEGQLPVSEAAPGNPMYDGGRWSLQFATWVDGTPEVLTSYEEVMAQVDAGNLEIESQETYFQCPLLPVKYECEG